MAVKQILQLFFVFSADQNNTIQAKRRSYPQDLETRRSRNLRRCYHRTVERFTIFIAMILAAWVTTGPAIGASVSLTTMPWHAYVGAGCSVRTTAGKAGARSYIFHCNGKSEAFPHISLQNT